MRAILWFVILTIVTACSAVDSTDTEATLQAENDTFATEIAALPDAVQSDATQAWATVVAGQTEAANVRNINTQLLATVAAVAPPTRSVVQQGGPPASAPQNTPGAGLENSDGDILLTGVGTSIRQSDGCLTQVGSSFQTSIEEIYAGLEAFNISAGIPIRAEWYQGSSLVYQFEWTVDNNYDRLCIWFSLTQADVTFQPGNWSVRLYAAGQQINGDINFTFETM